MPAGTKTLAAISLFLALFATASARTIHVPSDAPTIQAAIDMSSPGDTVFVHRGYQYDTWVYGVPVVFYSADYVLPSGQEAVEVYEVVSQTSGTIPADEYAWTSSPGYLGILFFSLNYDNEVLDISFRVFDGIYSERITIHTSITLAGEYAPTTTIFGSHEQPIVKITADDVVVDGFTFREAGGFGDVYGVDSGSCSGIVISNCRFQSIGGWLDTAAIHLLSCHGSRITNNSMVELNGWGDVSGIHLEACSGTEIFNNTVLDLGSWQMGAAIRLDGCSATNIRNNIASEIMWGSGYGVHCSGISSPQIDFNCFHGCGYGYCSPGPNDISSDPLFIDPFEGDCRLQQDPCQPGVINPCVDSGDPALAVIRGTTRSDGVQDSGIVDRGYHYPLVMTLGVTPDPLLAGKNALFTVTNGAPRTATWLALSLTGTSICYVPRLHVSLHLLNPLPAAGPTDTDGLGRVTWIRTIPPAAAGTEIWLQTVQQREFSNVAAVSIQ